MPTFLEALDLGTDLTSPLDLALRLCLALVLGVVISSLYRVTRVLPEKSTFPATLVLLTILIAMVTKVIGDNVARAFSLVGALSIVRFRTVVRDTEDTAYVIFAVVIGMALGANHIWVAAIGIAVVALASFLLMDRKGKPEAGFRHILTIRVGIGQDADALVKDAMNAFASEWQIHSVATAKQGVALEVTYELKMRALNQAEPFVRALHKLDGVQCVELSRYDSSKE
jgi:uncharacterized membrane protein YhiD involved in acid resistance